MQSLVDDEAERTLPQTLAHQSFASRRYALLSREVFGSSKETVEQMHRFRLATVRALSEMDPDIPPYTNFRNVGYARYRFRNGRITALKHKPFFQVDPAVNVLLGTKPRPFGRLADSVRHSPGLVHLLRVLLERVWCDLPGEVHVNVHPVRVRNFHESTIHNVAHATFEGTHTDSTHRVAVVLLDRHNVRPGTARTALYAKACAMGKRRDLPADEEEIERMRVVETELTHPFDAITFDDTHFKHDASDPRALDPSQKMWRCVLLVMMRLPCSNPSPIDNRPIDGYTPRTPRTKEEVQAHDMHMTHRTSAL